MLLQIVYFKTIFCYENASQSDAIQHFSNYLPDRVSDSIFLKSPSTTEISNVILSLNTNKAVGHDDISAYFLKVASTIIAPYLQCFFEFSFINGIFPENCSLAKIIPLHKKGNKTNPSNYRPISILTCFSKILERLKYNRFLEFFKKYNVIHKSQYGFQKHIAPSHACLDIVTTTLDNINQRKYTGLIFLDLQKAFDTVSHNILLKKLDHYGIRGPAHKLICSFLHRKQYVSVDGIQSEIESITYGVAQGSILGPLLFLLYINDLNNSVNCLPRLFADDTCLIIDSPNLASLETEMNKDLTNVYNWSIANKLSLNPSKSNHLIISPKQNILSPHVTLIVNNLPILSCDKAKYLGVFIDSRLNFHSHIKSVENKVARSVGILSKLKHFLPSNSLLKLYYAFIHPHLLYGLSIWGCTHKSYLSKLQTLQNKAVKIIGGGKYMDHATPFYSKLKILKIPELYKHEVAKLVFHHYHQRLPPLLSNLYIKTNHVSQKCTRSSSTANKPTLYIPLYKTTRLQKSIRYQGVKIWNKIPTSIKTKQSFKSFEVSYKNYLLNMY